MKMKCTVEESICAVLGVCFGWEEGLLSSVDFMWRKVSDSLQVIYFLQPRIASFLKFASLSEIGR